MIACLFHILHYFLRNRISINITMTYAGVTKRKTLVKVFAAYREYRENAEILYFR